MSPGYPVYAIASLQEGHVTWLNAIILSTTNSASKLASLKRRKETSNKNYFRNDFGCSDW